MPDSLWPRPAELAVLMEPYELERLSGTAAYGRERIGTPVRLIGADGPGEDGSPFESEANRHCVRDARPRRPWGSERARSAPIGRRRTAKRSRRSR
jgi:hypothetical protein